MGFYNISLSAKNTVINPINVLIFRKIFRFLVIISLEISLKNHFKSKKYDPFSE